MQCMAAAATTVGAASGIRAWLGRYAARIGPARMRAMTAGLGVVAVLGAGVALGGA